MNIQIDMNLISTLAGLVSIVLGGLAIWLSVHFYDRAKNAEKEVVRTLERIQAQADTLRDITSKQMTRLIKNVTEQRPIDEILTIISTVRNIPQDNLQLQFKQQEIEALTAQAIEGYIGAYYYAAVANFWTQLNLPDADIFDASNQVHSFIKASIDTSNRDFLNLQSLLSRVERTRIQSNPVYSYFVAVEQFWAARVKDSATVFVDREQGRSDGSAT